jgi:hypothetical protein
VKAEDCRDFNMELRNSGRKVSEDLAQRRRGAERGFKNVSIISFLRASAPLRDINQTSFSCK